MIIKGVFRRHERWNPVHPTSGAFWGMGIGIGCGVGWGPGFGPEAIGYVGVGCGIGFSVGITLAGIGIGLPANWVFEVPYNAVMATRSGALELARSSGLLSTKDVAGGGWNNVAPHISGLQREAYRRFCIFKPKCWLDKEDDLFDRKSTLPALTRSISESLGMVGGRFFNPRKDQLTKTIIQSNQACNRIIFKSVQGLLVPSNALTRITLVMLAMSTASSLVVPEMYSSSLNGGKP
ncbi:cadmium-induced protein AS8 isoform X3 [Fagus crenata]